VSHDDVGDDGSGGILIERAGAEAASAHVMTLKFSRRERDLMTSRMVAM